MYAVFNFILIVLTVLMVPVIGIVLLLRRKYRCGFFEKCGICNWEFIKEKLQHPPIWIHAVSVGEVMAAVPLVREIKKRFRDTPILLSTVTETGNFTARRNVKDVDQVIYFPFDYPFIVSRFVAKLKPKMFVAIEAEIWPNLLRELNRQDIPSMIVSGRISSTSSRNYFTFKFFFRKVLSYINCLSMQSCKDAERIIRVGAYPESVTVTGNIKFDHKVPAITPQEKEAIYSELNIAADQKIFIAGSTHKGEEEICIEVFNTLKQKFPDLVLVLAPRHPERFDEVEVLLKQAGAVYFRKSELLDAAGHTSPDVILLDTIGELAKIYSIGTIVFIGGSMVPVGGHNVLEPAVFSKPVIFGKHMNNFLEIATILTQKKAALQVAGKDEFTAQAVLLLEDAALRQHIGAAAFQVIMENSGALRKNMDILQQLLKQ